MKFKGFFKRLSELQKEYFEWLKDYWLAYLLLCIVLCIPLYLYLFWDNVESFFNKIFKRKKESEIEE